MLALAEQTHTAPQAIVSDELYLAYRDVMADVVSAFDKRSIENGRYWWGLWRVYHENLWRAVYDVGQFSAWLKDLRKERYGPGKTDFYKTMHAIERMKRWGKTEDEIRAMLGGMTTAIKDDMAELEDRKGKLLPEVSQRLAEEGVSQSEFIDRLNQMSPSDQRSEVLGLVRTESVYFLDDDVVYDETLGRLMVNVRWESRDDGLIYLGTVIITATELTKEKRHTTRPNYLPSKIADFVLGRFGLKR